MARGQAVQPQGDSATFAIQTMANFRTALGVRGVVANHGFNDPVGSSQLPLYSEFQTLYATAQSASPPTLSPLEFQTTSPSDDFATVIPFAISTYHPTEIEVWNSTATGAGGGYADITQAELQQWATQIKAGI